jgi:hypothetical protein
MQDELTDSGVKYYTLIKIEGGPYEKYYREIGRRIKC